MGVTVIARVRPPSANNLEPVISEAAGDEKISTLLAYSLGSPILTKTILESHPLFGLFICKVFLSSWCIDESGYHSVYDNIVFDPFWCKAFG